MKPAYVEIKIEETGEAVLYLSGTWSLMAANQPDSWIIVQEFLKKYPQCTKITFDTSFLEEKWDSSLLRFLTQMVRTLHAKHIETNFDKLPQGVIRLLKLYTFPLGEVPPSPLTPPSGINITSLLEVFPNLRSTTLEFLSFLGEVFLSFLRLFTREKSIRLADLFSFIQQTGPEALPIVCLINFLVGLTVAFVGAVQLSQFGANIYMANLVALAMVREMGAVMTGVIMCGRTGSAFAASIGTMKVTEEIDALKVTGISPIDFLVLPRMIALTIMMPLLCVFADFVGVVGGMVVGLSLFDLSFSEYYHQTINAINLTHFSTGIIKSVVFGGLISLWCCFRGLKCGSDSSSVGSATTSAVVSGITSLIIADAFFAVLFHVLSI